MSHLTLDALRKFDEEDDMDASLTQGPLDSEHRGPNSSSSMSDDESSAAFDSDEERMDRLMTPREVEEVELQYQESIKVLSPTEPTAVTTTAAAANGHRKSNSGLLGVSAQGSGNPTNHFRRVSKHLSQLRSEEEELRFDSTNMGMHQTTWYFAYGSNMNVAQLLTRIGNFTEKKLMYLPGYNLSFNKKVVMKPVRSKFVGRGADPSKCGFANVVPSSNPNDRVYGISYAVHQRQMDSMDVFEGVASGHYTRNTMTCYDSDDKPVQCEVYVAGFGATDDGLLPTDAYMSHLLGGRALLPPYYCDLLLKQPTIKK